MFEKLKAWWVEQRATIAANREKRRQEDQEARQRWRCRYKVWQNDEGEWCWMAYREGIVRSPIPEYIPHRWGGQKFDVESGVSNSEEEADAEGKKAKESILARYESKLRPEKAKPRS